MSNIEVKYDVLNQKATPAFFADIFANRPAAGFVGRVFISTDTYLIYRDNGTGWDLIGGTNTSPSGGNIYYFNGSVASSVIGYEQMSTTAIVSTTSNFTLTGNGLICEFITDAGQPNTTVIPAGNWNFSTYLSMSSNGGTPQITAQIYVYNGTTYTLIGTSSPETITGGTIKDFYQFATAVPYTTILSTDRIAIRFSIVNNSAGRVTTFYTQDNNISQVGTTFPAGLNVYVPYNGANQNTDLGLYNLSSKRININGATDNILYSLNVNGQSKFSNTIYGNYLSLNPISPISPLAIIQVGNRNVLNSSNAQILVGGFYTDSVPTNGHAFADNSALQKTSGSWAYASFDGRVDINGTGVTGDHYVSFQSAPTYNFTGTMLYNYGTYTTHSISNGTITNNYANYIANPSKTGTGVITTNYGLYIENQTAGSTNYSIYSAGGFNLLTGPLQVLNTINADYTGANIKLKGGGLGTTDGGIYINAIGNLFLSDWDGTRGFVTLANGNGYYFGGNFGIKTATPAFPLDVIGIARISSRLNVNNSTDNSNFQLNNSGGLLNTGGVSFNGLTFSTSTTADLTHFLYVFNGGAGQTLTLPLALGHNILYLIKNNTVNTMTVSCSGANTIQTLTGTTPATITLLANAIIYLISNGTVNYIQII